MTKVGTIEAEGYLGILNADFIVASYQATAKVSVHLAAILALQTNNNPITLGFVAGTLDLEITCDFQDHPSLLRACMAVRDQVSGYLWAAADYDDPTIVKLRLEESIGEDKGQEIRYQKNIEQIVRYVDGWRTVTKIYPVGQADGLPLSLSALFKESEATTKSSDASYGYLTLTSQYSYYEGWTSEGAALPDDMLVYKDGVDDTAQWVQGFSGRVVRCAIGDYAPASTYTIDYRHADYLVTAPSGSMHPVGHRYPRHDISDPSDLLRAGQDYLDTWKVGRVSYNARLPMTSPGNVDFELLQLGSAVKVRDEGLGINVESMIKRIRKPDLRRPERMEVDLDRALPLFSESFTRDPADESLLEDTMKLYNKNRAYTGVHVGGDQVCAAQVWPTEDYSLRYIRLNCKRHGTIGPTIVLAILSSRVVDTYYEGTSVLAWVRVAAGQLPPSMGWSERIPISCLMTTTGSFYISLHAPYGDIGSNNFIEWSNRYYSMDNGQNWLVTPDPGGPIGNWRTSYECYGVPREE